MKVKEFALCTKLRGGPGGWHCPCCNPYGCSPRKMKPKARRTIRRLGKLALAREVGGAVNCVGA